MTNSCTNKPKDTRANRGIDRTYGTTMIGQLWSHPRNVITFLATSPM
jgi:hypothetical protein